MTTVPEIFGSKVFDSRVMKARLSGEVYHSLKHTIQKGTKLDPSVANAVAAAMKDWAVENGATHFTHWFQPLTGITAEKHDSFITPAPDGRVIMEFSGKELIRGEPDASSFPSGGLRATFEARGYTAWDPTSYAFIKGKTLCIPTAFCSYGGEALDKKTPLLRSMEALNRQALRVLKLFGSEEVKHVTPSVGPEQEYFLIDKAEHNEVAPAQHELAPIYTTTNRATDQNQLTMEIMQRVAAKHGMVCLLHEKPFAGVNGSGKHNNWSLSTDTGVNLLSPGETPHENAQFLLFLAAVIQAVDDYQGLLRASVATAGNDHRLGANEAPPAVISIFLGDELTAVLDAIETDSAYVGAEKKKMKLGVDVLPRFIRDTTDRNRTSPFAFTGNKFEFRMLGSSQSIASPNVVLNTIMTEELSQFADRLEKAENFQSALQELLQETFTAHQRIIFNGNGYDDAWVAEAARRGLANLRDTVDCMPAYIDKKNVELFTKHAVLTETEMRARYEIHLENYCKVSAIEANTLLNMAQRSILPVAARYSGDLAKGMAHKQEAGLASTCRLEEHLIRRISGLSDQLLDVCQDLSQALEKAPAADSGIEAAHYFRGEINTRVRQAGDLISQLESLVDAKMWPYPTYADILFGV